VRLTVVGCSGSVPGPDSAASCYLVEAEGFALVLDLGDGATGALQRHVELTKIDTVLLSHLHADHCVGLTSLTVALKHGPARRDSAIPVLGPSNVTARVQELHGARTSGEHAQLAKLLAFDVVRERTWPIGPFQITARRVDHPVEAYAFRIEQGGRTLAYSGDCAPCAGLDEVARGADLALVEAAYVEDPANLAGVHHTPRDAGELAARVAVSKLVVTHVPPWHDAAAAAAEAAKAFPGPVESARPGGSYEV
jgi:ribonuclease BN (tRNA processing enzyme)